MSDKRRSSYEPAIVALAPAVLSAALLAHPYLAGRLPNEDAVAAAVAADTTRWGLAHLATGVASALVILAFLAIRGYLGDAGTHRLSALGVPFVVIGSTLFAMLPGMEFAPLAVAATGSGPAEVVAAQAAIRVWFVPVMAVGALTFVIGVFAFIWDITTARILSSPWNAVVVGALAVMAVSRAVPFSVAQFYVQSAAGIVALWPLAYRMWIDAMPQAAAPPRRAQALRS